MYYYIRIDEVISLADAIKKPSNKRGRKKNTSTEALQSAYERKRQQNRIYWKENRRKKKEYVKELENKIQNLEKEIVRLNGLVDTYKYKIGVHMIGEERDLDEFIQMQEQQIIKISKKLEEGKDKEELK